MAKRRRIELRPRNGRILVVGIVARISGGQNQKELSLDDQVDHAKQVVAELYDGPVEFVVIATTGKGERLDRPELGEVEDLLRSRRLDLLVVEDLGRLVRGVTAAWLCGIAVDHGTRVLAPNDFIDTEDEVWEEDVIQACRDHVGHNSHTSKRLKHKLMNRFKKHGGATPREIYGYIKPPGAKTFDEWQKDDAATLVYKEWFRMLREDPNAEAVADWLNNQGVPVGKYAQGTHWTGKMVRRITRNPILKGMPERGNKVTVKRHETGRRVSVNNPDGPETYSCPHLAHVDPAEFDEVNALVREANRGFGRKPVGGSDPRKGVSRKRTVWPGQHALCGICGRLYYWGGHGQTDHMMCSGNRGYTCWNGITFDGRLAATAIAGRVLAAIEQLPGFDPALVERVRAEAGAEQDTRAEELRQLDREEVETRRAAERVLATIEASLAGTPSGMLADRLTALEARLAAIPREREAIRRRPAVVRELPDVGEIKALARRALERLATGDPEFGRQMRVLLPEVTVFPVRAINGGRVVARARIVLDLASLLEGTTAAAVGRVLRQVLWVDLFEPAQRIKLRTQIAALRASGQTEREVAAVLGIQQPTVQRAMVLTRLMAFHGLTDPYEPLAGPPAGEHKMRRHRHPRYIFEPLPGFPATYTV
jgi:site-specific DNA recombinase